jgi:hypothetical protein
MPDAVKACIKPGATCVDIDVDKIDFSDPKIYELLGTGYTAGVFQVESAGMTATIKNMQPNEYKQIVALIALYRPGPLGAGMVDSYIKRMHGQEKISYYDDRLKPILEETYGTMVYQEQVMQISMKMCGFTAGESDSRMRKPVAKKKIKMLTEPDLPLGGQWRGRDDLRPLDERRRRKRLQEARWRRDLGERPRVRLLRVQQEPLRRLRHPGHADRVAQGVLSARVHGLGPHVLHGQDRQDRALRHELPSRGHPGPAA